jgi:arylsulfatase A-like enzyme
MNDPADMSRVRPGVERPNVLLVLTDDQGWDDLGIHGNFLVETPNLDRLAGRSVRFENFYATPVCAPTRAGLLTGRHYLRTGVCHVHGGRDFLHPGEVTMAQWFQANGYATGMWGKWHAGKTSGYFPWERGFDEAYMAQLYRHRDSVGEFNGERRCHTGWTVDTLTDYALDFIGRHRDVPFFAHLPYLTVHTPLLAPEELVEKYRRKDLSRPLALAYAMIDQLDTAIGRLLAGIDELGLTENTVIIFLSDNGPQYLGTDEMRPADYAKRYPSGMKGHKGSMWENGIRVPCFVSCPDWFPARQVERLADIYDLLPTLIDLCGLTVPPPGALPFDGRSIRPYLEGGGDLPPKRHVIFSNLGWPPIKAAADLSRIEHEEYHPVAPEEKQGIAFDVQLMGLRTEGHKLLRNPGHAEGAPAACRDEVLVDMVADRKEDVNLAAHETSLAEAMRQELAAWFDEAKTEPHAYHVPRFAVGPSTSNILYFYAPRRRLGQAWNGGLASFGWMSPGDGGEYLIQVAVSGCYRLILEGARIVGDGVWLRVEADGTPLLRALVKAGIDEMGTVALAVGDHILRIVVDEAAPSSDGIERLVGLRFTPA